MLLHHFGSREELLVSIVEEVERRQTTMLVRLPGDPAGAITAAWAELRRPELRPFERLFFECYARAAQGEVPFARLLPGAVHGWLAEIDERSGGQADRALVRLSLAVIRGLLLDLVATGDDQDVDAAAAYFAALLTPRQPSRARLRGRREEAAPDTQLGDVGVGAVEAVERTRQL